MNFFLIIASIFLISCLRDQNSLNQDNTKFFIPNLKNRYFSIIDPTNKSEKVVVHLNTCGAIDELYDVKNNAGKNLIAKSFQGEHTDRVIQWTYWNARYKSRVHTEGDKDRRLNVTLSGAYKDKEFCNSKWIDVNENIVTISATASSWFYSNLNDHGRAEIDSIIKYTFNQNGTIDLKIELYRDQWFLENIFLFNPQNNLYFYQNGFSEVISKTEGLGTFTSYIELWAPFNAEILSKTTDGSGNDFTNTEDPTQWYKQWNPIDLNGYTYVHNGNHGVALVFGKIRKINSEKFLTFNKLYTYNSSQGYLNVIMPAIETSWPEFSFINLNFKIIVGSISDINFYGDLLTSQIKRPY